MRRMIHAEDTNAIVYSLLWLTEYKPAHHLLAQEINALDGWFNASRSTLNDYSKNIRYDDVHRAMPALIFEILRVMDVKKKAGIGIWTFDFDQSPSRFFLDYQEPPPPPPNPNKCGSTYPLNLNRVFRKLSHLTSTAQHPDKTATLFGQYGIQTTPEQVERWTKPSNKAEHEAMPYQAMNAYLHLLTDQKDLRREFMQCVPPKATKAL